MRIRRTHPVGVRLAGVTTTTPVAKLPRSLVTGLVSRNFTRGSGVERSVIDSIVLDPTWGYLQPSRGALNAAAVASIGSPLDWCDSHLGTSGRPIMVRLRLKFGIGAPAWAKSIGGPALPWYTNRGNDGTGAVAPGDTTNTWHEIPGGLGRWWATAYLDAAEEFLSLVAAEFKDHPALAEVTMGFPATQFQEPCITQFGHQLNVDNAVALGYSDAEHDAAFERGWYAH